MNRDEIKKQIKDLKDEIASEMEEIEATKTYIGDLKREIEALENKLEKKPPINCRRICKMRYITDGKCIVNLDLISDILPWYTNGAWRIEFGKIGLDGPIIFYYNSEVERNLAFDKIMSLLNPKTI